MRPFGNERAPALDVALSSLNVDGAQLSTLSDFLKRGAYIVLWFYPEDATGLQDGNNAKEAINFERLKAEFGELDAVLVACSAQATNRQRKLVDEKLLTIPFLSDPDLKLVGAFGAFRATFIIDPSGMVRWAERNVEFGVGNFNLDNHAERVRRELYRIRNADGWSV